MTFLWSLCRNLWPPLRRVIKTPETQDETNALAIPTPKQNENLLAKTTSLGVTLAKWPEILLPTLHKRTRESSSYAEESERLSEGETRIEISWDASKETISSNQTETPIDERSNSNALDLSSETSPCFDSQKIHLFTPTTIKLDQSANWNLATGQVIGAKTPPNDEEFVPLEQMYNNRGASREIDVGWCCLNSDEILCATIPFASGASSQVYRGLYRDEEVVLKFITSTQEASFEKEFRRECRILQKIPQHEKIVKMYGVVGTCLVLEYCNLGSLFDLIHNPRVFLPLAKIKDLLVDIAESMEVLHSRRIIHRDLKSGNLLVSRVAQGREIVKLADFGLARNYLKNSTMTVGIGTWQYSSPEFFKNKKLTTKSDVYSFGVVLWELCTRKQPYYGRSFQEIFKCIMEKTDYSLRMPAMVDENLTALYYNCVAMDPIHRPSFKEILKSLHEINVS